jgi:glycosyltransferase involved in cell wall biosynthesis
MVKVKYGLFQRSDSSGLMDIVTDLLARQEFDVVVVEHSKLAAMLVDMLRAWGGPCIADLHNVMYALEQRGNSSQGYSARDHRAIGEYEAAERLILESYARVSVVSHIEAASLRRLSPQGQIEVLPNGVDVDYFMAEGPSTSVGTAPATLIFTGLLYHQPNVDALSFFAREIWPLIRRQREVRLLIVGAGPAPATVKALASEPGIEMFVSVPDVRPFFAASHVAIVPLRWGGGTRLKILEALSAAMPVVSTTFGAEGLRLQSQKDLVLADTPAEFADAVLQLLEQPRDAEQLGRHGATTVRRHYSWDRTASRFQALVREVLAGGMPLS